MINWIKKKLLNKKCLGCGLVVFIILFVALIGLLYFHSGKWPWEMVIYQPLTEEEIQEKLPTLTRNYPDIIKGNWEPNADYMEKMIISDSDRLKDLGVNTVSVAAEYNFNKDGTPFIRDEEKIKSNIVRAKEKGFAVWVAVSFVGMFGNIHEGVTQENFLKVSEEVALKWAKIAEECQVEYFGPQNELDYIIEQNFIKDSSTNAEIIADWYEKMLPKVKEVYSGKVIAKFSRPGGDMIPTASQYIGYDYVGTAIFHRFKGIENYRDSLVPEYSLMADLASKSNSEWIVGEAFYLYLPIPINFKGELLSRLQDDYYKISVEEYLKFEKNKPAGYIFHSWRMPMAAVKNRSAENVLKEFFNTL